MRKFNEERGRRTLNSIASLMQDVTLEMLSVPPATRQSPFETIDKVHALIQEDLDLTTDDWKEALLHVVFNQTFEQIKKTYGADCADCPDTCPETECEKHPLRPENKKDVKREAITIYGKTPDAIVLGNRLTALGLVFDNQEATPARLYDKAQQEGIEGILVTYGEKFVSGTVDTQFRALKLAFNK